MDLPHSCNNKSLDGQISSLTTELAALKRLKKLLYNVVRTLALSFLILVGNEDNHNSLN